MNEERDRIVRMLGDSFLAESLSALSRLYDKAEEETERFCQENSIQCGSGCGECCEHFMPDITTIEAKMVAAHLLLVRHDLLLIDRIMSSSDSSHCPLYDGENPEHCTVYASRPLICRLFGQCASRDKRGLSTFRRCRYNKEKTMPDHLVLGEDAPVMDRYGTALRSLDEEAGETEDLDEAVRKALVAVHLVLSLSSRDSDDDSTPTPLAG